MAYLTRLREVKLASDPEAHAASTDRETYDWLIWGNPFSFRLGEIHFLLGDYDSAIDAYERSLKLKADHYNAFYRLGLAYERLGEPDKAVANFEKYIGVTELNAYDGTALRRERSCGAIRACHSISRPEALLDSRQQLERLR
jgi:tetratricopeptide (TPR) repeat protein